jgi:hypothetical protein
MVNSGSRIKIYAYHNPNDLIMIYRIWGFLGLSYLYYLSHELLFTIHYPPSTIHYQLINESSPTNIIRSQRFGDW